MTALSCLTVLSSTIPPGRGRSIFVRASRCWTAKADSGFLFAVTNLFQVSHELTWRYIRLAYHFAFSRPQTGSRTGQKICCETCLLAVLQLESHQIFRSVRLPVCSRDSSVYASESSKCVPSENILNIIYCGTNITMFYTRFYRTSKQLILRCSGSHLVIGLADTLSRKLLLFFLLYLKELFSSFSKVWYASSVLKSRFLYKHA